MAPVGSVTVLVRLTVGIGGDGVARRPLDDDSGAGHAHHDIEGSRGDRPAQAVGDDEMGDVGAGRGRDENKSRLVGDGRVRQRERGLPVCVTLQA